MNLYQGEAACKEYGIVGAFESIVKVKTISSDYSTHNTIRYHISLTAYSGTSSLSRTYCLGYLQFDTVLFRTFDSITSSTKPFWSLSSHRNQKPPRGIWQLLSPPGRRQRRCSEQLPNIKYRQDGWNAAKFRPGPSRMSTGMFCREKKEEWSTAGECYNSGVVMRLLR